MDLDRIESHTTHPPTYDSNHLADGRFETIITEVDEYAIILLDLNGIVISWNKGVERIKGYSADEIIGKSYKIFYPKEDIEKGLPDLLLEQATKKGRVNHEGYRVRKDGYRFWGSITITALHDTDGRVSGYLKITRDLTNKKLAEDKYSNMLEELRLKNGELKREEERYHQMVSEVRDYAIILLDPEGKILEWNRGAEQLKGYTADEIVGKNFRLFYPAEDKLTDLPQRLLNTAASQGFVNHEGYRIRKDGTRFWGSVAITALHNNEGKIIGFSKVTKDLTERKAAEDRLGIFTQELQQINEQLRRSEERYHRMISEVQDYAILLLNGRGEILNWNTGAELIKGYHASDIIGKSFRLFYFQDDIDRGLPERLLREAYEKGKASSEGWRKRKDGTRFWASVVITALHDSKGEVIGFSKVTRDLTERKKSEDAIKENALQLELKNHELERLNAELSSFAYVVSHDLKEPIRKIQVFAGRQLEDDKSIEQIREYSRKITASAKRMQSLMESLLSYSRISNDESPHEQVDLNDVLSDVRVDLELVISESDADIQSSRLPVVTGIRFQLQQLFLNLITNSIKFAHPDRAPVITITSALIPNDSVPEELIIKNLPYNCLTFADNGVGFHPDQAEKIFDVFKRLRSTDVQGTGIGLAIVKKVAVNHNGIVKAAGVPNEGAKFEVYLPG